MALDFGILQPANISGQLQAGQESAMRNQLAQQQLAAGQQQMETGRMQQEKAGLELQQFKRRQAGLDRWLGEAEKGGQTGDPEQLAESFYKFAREHGDPQLLMSAQQVLMAAKERKQYLSERMPKAPAAGMPNALAPAGSEDRLGDFISQIDAKQNAPMPMPAVTGGALPPAAAPNMLAPAPAASMRAPAAPANALAAPAAPANALAAPVAPANALAAPMGAVDPAVEALQSKIIDLEIRYPSGAAKNEIARLNKQLDEMQKTHVVGRSLVTNTGRKIYESQDITPSEIKRLTLERDALPLNDPMRAVYDARIIKESTHAPGTSVTVTQEKAEAGDYGKFLVKQFESVTKAADLAQKSLPAIEGNLASLDRGFDTGFGTETKASGAKVLAALGVKDAEKYATNSQTFLANASAAVLQKQLEQKGPQTESDAQRITQTGAQLGNTKDANRFVLNVAKAQLQRDIDQRKFYSDWRKANKTFDGADDAWNSGAGSKSLFDTPALKKYAQPTDTSPTPAADKRPSLNSIFAPAR